MQSQSSQVLSGNQPTQEVSCNAFNSSDYQSSTTLCLSCQLSCGLCTSWTDSLCCRPCSSLKDAFCLFYHTILIWKSMLNLSGPAVNPVVMGSFNLLMTMLKAYLKEHTQVAVSKNMMKRIWSFEMALMLTVLSFPWLRALEERQKQWDVQEQRLRQNILQQRRQRVQDATERFQRAHLPPSQRYRQCQWSVLHTSEWHNAQWCWHVCFVF